MTFKSSSNHSIYIKQEPTSKPAWGTGKLKVQSRLEVTLIATSHIKMSPGWTVLGKANQILTET